MKNWIILLQLIFFKFSLLSFESKNFDIEISKNKIPPRLQWNENFGYCGEASFISAGLYYGQYLSQYTARSVASNETPQYLAKSQLLLGVNDQQAAKKMHLKFIAWPSDQEINTEEFLSWVKGNVVQGYPVIIGVYTNEFLFYGKKNPNAGDPDYDHIVPVFGIGSNHSLTDSRYYTDDIIYFSDNGLWGSSSNPPYLFHYPFSIFQANRKEANNPKGEIYSLSNSGKNFGIAITGVMDKNRETLPVRIKTSVNDEVPEIKKHSNKPPESSPLTLTITISNLKPGVHYKLYRYNNLADVPDSNFNTLAHQAIQSWNIQIESGSKFVMKEEIDSNEVAIYRAVKASGP